MDTKVLKNIFKKPVDQRNVRKHNLFTLFHAIHGFLSFVVSFIRTPMLIQGRLERTETKRNTF